MIRNLMNENNSINSMICKFLVKILHVLLEKMLLYFDHIGSTMSREMDNIELVNVVMVQNEQLLSYMPLLKLTPLVWNILFNVSSLP